MQLDAEQRMLVEGDFAGPVLVLGGAGTGKSVVGLKRAAWLARNVFAEPGDNILVTTNSRVLADSLSFRFGQMDVQDISSRIEIHTLAKIAIGILRDFGIRLEWNWQSRKSYGSKFLQKAYDIARAASNFHSELDSNVLIDEYFTVVRRYEITTKPVYLKNTHSNFSRTERIKIWELFRKLRLVFSGSLGGLKLSRQDGFTLAAYLCKYSQHQKYKSVIVDEAHDIDESSARFISALTCNDGGLVIPNSLFLVSDPLQRTYRGVVDLETCNIRVDGRTFNLHRNYRNTEAIATAARQAILTLPTSVLKEFPKDVLAGLDVVRSGGPKCSEYRPATKSDFEDYIVHTIRGWKERTVGCASRLCWSDYSILTLDEFSANQIRGCLISRGVPVGDNKKIGAASNADGVCVQTVYAAKGLAYEGVIVVVEDSARDSDNLPSLLYVAKSRAKDYLSEVSLDGNLLYGKDAQLYRSTVVDTSAPAEIKSASDVECLGRQEIEGAISGYELVERILDRFGDEGIAKLLECTDHTETEFLEFKTSHRLSEDERKAFNRMR